MFARSFEIFHNCNINIMTTESVKVSPGIKIALRLRVLSSSPCRVAEGCTIFASSKDFKSPTVSQQSGRHFFVGALGGVSLSECQSSAPQCQRQSVSAVRRGCLSVSLSGASVSVSVSVSRRCLSVSLSPA